MKKFLLIASLVSSYAFADGYGKNKKEDAPPPLSEATLTPVTSRCNAYVSGDFIYWKARQDGMAAAEDGRGFTNSASVPQTFQRGSVKDLHYKFRPGFKVGLGINFERDGWDLYTNYTWLFNKNSHHLIFTENFATGAMNSEWFVPAVFPNTSLALPIGLLSGNADWHVHFNTLDLELGRNSYFGHFVTMRPHIGFKGAWINQHYGVNYSAFANGTPPPIVMINLHMKQEYSGYGIRAGNNAAWEFVKHWSVFGDIAVSALWSDFDSHRKDTTTVTGVNSGLPYTSYNIQNKFITIRPVLEMDIGLKFCYEFSPQQSRIDVQAGWEEQIWFNHNQYNNAGGTTHYGDLNFHGLTAKLGYLF